jgi:hypothetical protein
MLVMALGLMIGMWLHANRLRQQEDSVEDKSGTATVRAETEMPADEQAAPDIGDTVEAVEIARLSDFQDHARDIEPDPYYYLLDLARRNPAKWMEQHARRDVTFAHLFHAMKQEPDKYRGQLLFLKGRLRQLKQLELDDNEYGLTLAYEGSVFTDESGTNPYVVLVSEAPTGMPLGPTLEYVSVAGYFLGWWRYTDAQGKPYSAPLIVARRFVWHQVPPLRPDANIHPAFGLAIGIAIAAGCVIAAIFTLRRKPAESVGSASEHYSPVLFDQPQGTAESDGTKPE